MSEHVLRGVGGLRLFAAGVLLSISGCGQHAEALDGAGGGAIGAEAQAYGVDGTASDEDPKKWENPYACDGNPESSGGINWHPDVLHPVFRGYRDLGTADGAPGPLRIHYPTLDGTPQGAALLKLCRGHYPVVLLLHGQGPCQPPKSETDQEYYKRWDTIARVLARSGYVVVVPKHFPASPNSDQTAEINLALGALDWARETWDGSPWTDPKPDATAIVGHSWGALLAARVRAVRPTISVYVGLSGVWGDYGDVATMAADLGAIKPPFFFMHGDEQKEAGNPLWIDYMPHPRTHIIYQGEHFDYLNTSGSSLTCAPTFGTCPLLGNLTADLVALYISRHVPPHSMLDPIPPSLIPPKVNLTFEQELYSSSHLQSFDWIKSAPECHIHMSWEAPEDSGEQYFGG